METTIFRGYVSFRECIPRQKKIHSEGEITVDPKTDPNAESSSSSSSSSSSAEEEEVRPVDTHDCLWDFLVNAGGMCCFFCFMLIM